MVPDSTVTTEDSIYSLDHSSDLSEVMGRIFDSGNACDFLIVVKGWNEDASEMVSQTVCAHKMILSPFQPFNVSEGSERITINVRHPCLQHFTTFIRYQVICVAGIKEKVEKTL